MTMVQIHIGVSKTGSPKTLGKHYTSMLQQLHRLTCKENLTDTTFYCSDGQVQAHWCVLAAVSPFFQKVSSLTGTVAGDSRTILILNDFACAAVSQLLNILYHGSVDDLTLEELDTINELCTIFEMRFPAKSVKLTRKKTSDTVLQSPGNGGFALGVGRTKPSRLISESKNIRERKPVYCLCGGGEGPKMIGCDYCTEWYHPDCLNLSKGEVKTLASTKWRCPKCEFKKTVNSRKHGGMKTAEECSVSSKVDLKIALPDVDNGIRGWSKTDGNFWVSNTDEADGDEQADENPKQGSRVTRKSASISSIEDHEYAQTGSNGVQPRSLKRKSKFKPPIAKRRKMQQENKARTTARRPEQQHGPRKNGEADGVDQNEDKDKNPKSRSQSPPPDEERIDKIFFCYRCKAIFITRSALIDHEKTGH